MIKGRATVASLICAMLLFGPGHAAEIIPEISILRPPFTERIDPNVLASGGLVVGVLMGPLDLRISDPIITVSGIQDTDQSICISIRHINGSYSGGFTTKNPQKGHTLRFRIPSKNIQEFGAKAAALAILAQASKGASCNHNDAILPATWGRRQISSAGYALVNDHQADMTRGRIGSQRAQNCMPLAGIVGAGVATRSFQVACAINNVGKCGVGTAPLVVQFVESGKQTEIRPQIRPAC